MKSRLVGIVTKGVKQMEIKARYKELQKIHGKKESKIISILAKEFNLHKQDIEFILAI